MHISHVKWFLQVKTMLRNILTTTLDWAKQVHWVCIKAIGKLAVLRNVHFTRRKTLDILFKVTVRSVLDYALPVYYQSLNTLHKKPTCTNAV